MVEGTRMKQLEARLDFLELGLKQTQEEVSLNRKENAETREAMQTLERSVQTMTENLRKNLLTSTKSWTI